MAREAIELYIEHLKEKSLDVPDDSNTIEISVNIDAA
jgi:predicted RNase H-like HicB family nuclease